MKRANPAVRRRAAPTHVPGAQSGSPRREAVGNRGWCAGCILEFPGRREAEEGAGPAGRPAPPRPCAAREPRVPSRAEVTGRRWRPRRAPARSRGGRSPRPASRETQAGMEECRVLSIQSHVVRGYVGNRAATFPLQVLLRNPRGSPRLAAADPPDLGGAPEAAAGAVRSAGCRPPAGSTWGAPQVPCAPASTHPFPLPSACGRAPWGREDAAQWPGSHASRDAAFEVCQPFHTGCPYGTPCLPLPACPWWRG